MTVAIGEAVRLTLFYTAAAASVANTVFNFVGTTAGSDDTDVLDALEDWIDTFWAPAWADLASDSSELEGFSVDKMNLDGTVAANIGTGDTNVAGTQVADTSTAAVAGYLLAQTELPKQRGSKYIPFLSEGATVDGKLNATALTDMALLLVSYLATINVSGGGKLAPGVLSRTLVEFVPFLPQGTVNDVPAYQRRRKPFVGS